MDAIRALHREARAHNERRLLVLTGSPAATRNRAVEALAATDIDANRTQYVGPAESFPGERVPMRRAEQLMGTTCETVVLDCHEACRPNALGQAVGTVDGGGLLVCLTPPLGEWPDMSDEFDASLAVPPFERSQVTGEFRERLVETLRAHRGIAIVDAESGEVRRDGLTGETPRLPAQIPEPPTDHQFPRAAFEHCLTADQMDAVENLQRLAEDGNAVVVEADRGRGKSSAAGIAAACLAHGGKDVLVTAPTYQNARELFVRAREMLNRLGTTVTVDTESHPGERETDEGTVQFEEPVQAAEQAASADCVVVDEAAALPVHVLERFLNARSVAFTTTIHGYEGTGRGFSVRFRDRLAESSLSVTDVHLAEPIRYGPADPVEVWSFRALALGASPAADQLVAEASPESVTYCELSSADLRGDGHLLGEVFGLLVLAHYRTEPNDLARLLDAPNVSVHALLHDGHVVSVALLAREGGLDAGLRAEMYGGESVAGNLIPDVLTGQLRDPDGAETVGNRVLRIATHSAVRSRGLGSRLLDEIRDQSTVDWLGVGYGASPELVAFWRANGFSTVHLATSRNDRSGEHSVIMLDALTQDGERLLDRHTEWFLRRAPSTFAGPLSDVDPAVIRAVCRATAGIPSLDVSDFEWRVLAGLPAGTAHYDTAPRAVRRLVVRHLVAGETDVLSSREEQLLVRKVLQTAAWDTVAAELSYPSVANCRRALGEAVEPLVETYSDGEWSP